MSNVKRERKNVVYSNEYEMKTRRSSLLFASFGCGLIVVSQFFSLVNPVYTALWIGFAIALMVESRSRPLLSGFSKLMFLISLLISLFCFLCYLMTGQMGYIDSFLILYLKALLSYVVGLGLFSAFWNTSSWRVFFAVFNCAALVYLAYVYINYFPGWTAWLSSQTYIFGSKNSFGQIVGVACLTCVGQLLLTEKNSRLDILALFFTLLYLVTLLVFQCRTSMLGVGLGFVLMAIFCKKKRWLAVPAIILILLVVFNSDFQIVFAHFLQTDKYDTLNGLSSGRLEIWDRALERTSLSPLIGLGKYYCDNFYICIYANWGVIGSIVFMVMWFARICQNYLYVKRPTSGTPKGLPILLAGMTGFYLVESVLEGNPPLGPGACSFVFWMLNGYLDMCFESSRALEQQCVNKLDAR